MINEHHPDKSLPDKQRPADNVTHNCDLNTTNRNPTAPRQLRHTPRIHSRTTRANNPLNGRTPIDPGLPPRRSPWLNPTLTIPALRPPPSLRAHRTISTSHSISRHAINALITNTISANGLKFEHYACPMTHPVTGELITSYRKLMNDPATAETWQTAFGKDFGCMAQGDSKTGQKGTNSMFVMTHNEIPNIPSDRVVTYAKVVVDYRPQKEDPNRIRITAGGNLITYPGELYTRTADLTTSKLLWNSVLSTPNAKYMCLDIKNFYLSAPLDRYEYMKIPLHLFPPWIKQQYDLSTHAYQDFVYIEMRRAVWGLPQAGILANKLLKQRLAPHGYYECANTPGLWRHTTSSIMFTLVVDDFGIKYTNKNDVQHLISCLKTHYGLTEDWTGNLYCGIRLEWNYKTRTLDISMPGYIRKLLQKYKHVMPKTQQHCPFTPPPKQYGAVTQSTQAPDDSNPPLRC